MKFQQLFVGRTRPDGESYICLSEKAPESLQKFVQMVHSNDFYGCFPNDWVFDQIAYSFEVIEDGYEYVEADRYIHELLEWLYQNCYFAVPYVDSVIEENEASSDFWESASLTDLLRNAQQSAINNIFERVNDFIINHSEGDENNQNK